MSSGAAAAANGWDDPQTAEAGANGWNGLQTKEAA
jgi:hypothetical protein